MKKAHKSFLATTGVAALAFAAAAAPAWSQESSGQPNTEDSSAQIQDIVVTAQRRGESLQRTPVAVTVANAEALAELRVENVENIRALTPSVNFTTSYNAAASANLQIRGVGTSGTTRSFEGAVGVFVDGVYRSRSGMALSNFLDIDNLQILRGPQGTLFGKNTSAGALLLASAEPELSQTSGSLELTGGNYDLLSGEAMFNLPLGESAAFRIAALSTRSDGWITDPNTERSIDNTRKYGIKGQLLVEPSDSLSIRVIGDYARENDRCCSANVDNLDGPTQPIINALGLARGLQLPSPDWQDYEQVLSLDTRQRVIDAGGALLVEWEPSFGGTLQSVTAFRYWQDKNDAIDGDFTIANILTDDDHFTSEVFSQEFTYNGEVGAGTTYVFGAYYSRETIDATRALFWGDQAQIYWDTVLSFRGIPPGTVAAPVGLWDDIEMRGTGTSLAAFTHWNIALGDDLTLIAGARYTHEEKTGSMYNSYAEPAPNGVFRLLGVLPGPAFDDEHTDNSISGAIGLQYQLSPDAMAYLTYSRGFKAGGVNLDANAAGLYTANPDYFPGATPSSPAFRPETVDGYELGLKVDYLNRRARTNIAVFYNDISDLQVAQFQGLQFAVLNAPSATVYGVEIENSFLLTQALTLAAAATWLPEASYGDSVTLGAPLSGRRFSSAPRFAGSLSLSLDQPIGDSMSLLGMLAARYQGEVFTNPANNATQGAYVLVDLNLGLRFEDLGVTLTGWARNLTDERYQVFGFNTPFQTGDVNTYVGAPQTFGATLSYRF